MPRKILPRLVAVAIGERPYTMRITWDSGSENLVDVSGLIEKFRVYAPLRQSPELFSRARVGEYGTDVIWSEEIDMSANSLWRLSQEQVGFTMSAQAFREWRERNAYTFDDAAAALGISRRMVVYYDQGNKPIPRVVALATRALALTPPTTPPRPA